MKRLSVLVFLQNTFTSAKDGVISVYYAGQGESLTLASE